MRERALSLTFFLNQFTELKNTKINSKKILISKDSLFNKKLLKLRKEGWITIQNFDGKNNYQLAKLHNCKFIFQNNEVKKI